MAILAMRVRAILLVRVPPGEARRISQSAA